MVDYFALSGATPLSNGFLARYTTDLAEFFRIRPVDAFGDPFDFTAGAARCDPL